MLTVKLGSKDRISLPKYVIEKLDLTEGDTFTIEVNNGRIILEPNMESLEEENEIFYKESLESLKRALNDVEKGHTNGPFNNADELIKSLHS